MLEKGDMEIEDILGMRTDKTGQHTSLPPACFFPTFTLCDIGSRPPDWART